MRIWKRTAVAVSVVALCGVAAAPDTAPDRAWPSWRGPAENGSTGKGTYPARFGPEKNVAWKLALPGKGCSTPIVWEDRILLTAPADGQDAVLCVDFAGKQLWRTAVGTAEKGKHRNGSGSNPSAVTDGEHVFAFFKSGNLAGLDLATGKVLWRANLQERFGKFRLYWDFGTSPVLTEKHVVAAAMHGGDSYLAAFEKKSGKMAWRVERNYETPTENDHSYTTPLVYRRDGKERLLVWGAEHLTAHDASDGKVIWSCGGFNPQGKKNWVVVGSPVIVGDHAIFSFGRGNRLHGVRLGGSGDVTKTHRTWNREGIGSFVPTPAAQGGRVYLVRDRGAVVCIDPSTGKTIWEGSLPKHRAKFYSSPTIADGKLYAAREDGVVMVASIAGGKFEFLAENEMGERIIASPVPVADHLLIRGELHLYCLRAQ